MTKPGPREREFFRNLPDTEEDYEREQERRERALRRVEMEILREEKRKLKGLEAEERENQPVDLGGDGEEEEAGETPEARFLQ
jgi:hypothetical protein